VSILYLVHVGNGGYVEHENRSDAYADIMMADRCDECHRNITLRDQVIFEHISQDSEYEAVYLTVSCMACAPEIWARIRVAGAERDAILAG
jgi:predicted metal-binding protein